MLQADGNYDLEKNVNIGDAGDIWLPGMKLAPGDGKTFPNSDSYQGGNIQKTGVTIEVLELRGQNIDLQITVPSRRSGGNTNTTESFSTPQKQHHSNEAELQFHVPDAVDQDVRISGKIPQLPWREEQLLDSTSKATSSLPEQSAAAVLLPVLFGLVFLV